jgi:hypothetical protein
MSLPSIIAMDISPWVEDPPVHPRILYYVGMSSVVSDRIRVSLGLPYESGMTVPNWVDLDRFRFVRNPARKPLKAGQVPRYLAVCLSPA